MTTPTTPQPEGEAALLPCPPNAWTYEQAQKLSGSKDQDAVGALAMNLTSAFSRWRDQCAASRPSPAEASGPLREWRDEITHPNNRLLFRRMCEKADVDLKTDDIASALVKVAALASAPAAPEADNQDAAMVAMLSRDHARMRKAGTALAEAALYSVREYDGLHRLALSAGEWAKAVADEGDRAPPQPALGEENGRGERARGAGDDRANCLLGV